MQVRNLELLKLRFGEGNLYFCEVMIKDVADSKRINSHILSKSNNESNDGVIHTCILTLNLIHTYIHTPCTLTYIQT